MVRFLALLLLVGAATAQGPVSPTGRAVGQATDLDVNQPLLVEWGGQWWAGTVLEVLKDGRVKIHYTGWAARWDEVVTRQRLQLGAPVVPRPALVPPDKHWRPGALEPTGRAVKDETRLVKGQPLLVEWGGHWWGAKVLAVRHDGMVRIHYVGWEERWDEWVDPKRLLLDSNPPRVINRHPSDR
ncbi:MAG: Tudor-knot domain-containing protein [Planctomycetota bacterium]